jgi:hypothetical protein
MTKPKLLHARGTSKHALTAPRRSGGYGQGTRLLLRAEDFLAKLLRLATDNHSGTFLV